MIPQLVTVGMRRTGHRFHRFWIPVVPAAVVLSPLLLLAVLAGLVACRVYRISPAGALRGAGQLLWALPGTRVEIEDDQMTLLLSVR